MFVYSGSLSVIENIWLNETMIPDKMWLSRLWNNLSLS